MREGVDPNSLKKLLIGTLHHATVALLAVLLVSMVGGSFLRRAGAVVVGGAIGTNYITLGDPIWFHLPWDLTTGQTLYELVSWIILGAVTAAIVAPPRQAAPAKSPTTP